MISVKLANAKTTKDLTYVQTLLKHSLSTLDFVNKCITLSEDC